MVASPAANSRTFEVSTPSDREIRMTRVFNAPRSLVFEAMSKPEHVKRWWGILDEHHSVPDLRDRLLASAAPGASSPAGPCAATCQLLRRLPRDRRPRPDRLHRNLRALPRHGIRRDQRAHRGGQTDAAHGDGHLSIARGARHGDQDRHGEGCRHQLRPPRRRRRGAQRELKASTRTPRPLNGASSPAPNAVEG